MKTKYRVITILEHNGDLFVPQVGTKLLWWWSWSCLSNYGERIFCTDCDPAIAKFETMGEALAWIDRHKHETNYLPSVIAV